MIRYLLALLLSACIISCGPAHVLTAPQQRPVPLAPHVQVTPVDEVEPLDTIVEVWTLDFLIGEGFAWIPEVADAYPGAVVIFTHGHSQAHDVRLILDGPAGRPMTAVDAVAYVRGTYGADKVVVLVACNEGGVHPQAEGIAYALDDVWIVPDVVVTEEDNEYRDTLYPTGDAVGSIDEFHYRPFN